MTVIAFRDGVMAADGWMSTGDFPQDRPFPKIVRLADGTLVGASGFTSDCYLALQWFVAGEDRGKLPHFSGNDKDNTEIDVLVARPDGSLWRSASGLDTLYPVPQPYAIGNRDACTVAMTAFHLCHDAANAVSLAKAMCSSIGGDIQVEHVGPVELAARAQ